MSYVKMGDFSSLFMVQDVKTALEDLNDSDFNYVYSELLYLNEYGNHTEYYKVEFLEGKGYTDIFEIKVKLPFKREYRILATKCSTGKSPADYLLLHAFFKKDKKIKDKDKKLARKRMIEEGL